MTNNAPTTSSNPDLLELVQRCAKLCTDAERSIAKLTPDREAFLSKNLAAAIQQVELVLRVLGETSEGHRDAERQSLLKRIFARNGEAPEGITGDENIQDIEISSQGLQGNSWTVSLAELLGFLAFAHKTGVLWVDSPQENFLLGIVNGNLMHASSDHTPEGMRLGEVLVGLGFLTRRQLERFLQSRPDGENVSGEVLLDSGMICDDELRQALTFQVRKLFARLVKTEQAVFRFQDGLNVQLAYQVDLDVNSLLLDSARSSDEIDSPALKAASAVHEWNSWRQDLGEKLEDNTTAPSPQSAAAAATKNVDDVAGLNSDPKAKNSSPSDSKHEAVQAEKNSKDEAKSGKHKPAKSS